MDLKVYIASHKAYGFPIDPAYQPIHVGRALRNVDLGFPGDDTGQNISELNASYCELTALFWMWRNTYHEAYGLVHYRRYFRGRDGKPATGEEMIDLLKGTDIVVPRRRHYVVQTVRQHYGNSHHARDLDVAEKAIHEISPFYDSAFRAVMRSRSISLYNMFLMRQHLLNDYCEWLFGVLEAVRPLVPIDQYGPHQSRVMGFLSERLFNVWLEAHPQLKIRHCRVFQSEPISIVRAGSAMLGRMIGIGRKP